MDFNATVMERVLGDIRRQRERLDAVEEFLARADEQTVELLQQALGSIGDSVVKGVEDSNIVNGVSAVPVESNESHRQSISEPERPRVARGALDAAVRDACDEIGSNISLFGVVKVLESHDFQFGPGDPKRAVSIKLGRLAAKGFLRVTEPASGRSPCHLRGHRNGGYRERSCRRSDHGKSGRPSGSAHQSRRKRRDGDPK